MLRGLVSTLVLLPLVVGGTTTQREPNYPRLEDCPFLVDPNLVVGKLLACVRVEVGQPLIHTRTWQDPEGDPAAVRIVKGPEGVRIVNRPRLNSYTILWTPQQVMTAAIVVQVTDAPAVGRPESDVGTILVQVTPRGRRGAPPHGCGGPPQ
ncbi:MAG: hypothetical protein MUC88_03905 [Planctomycetes bacterium]|jgi:hypothetical protein|nr:hypothetical protein [Planctomycetota bacterium]